MKPNEAATPQTAPVANECPHIADLVIEDILARKAEGVRKYGTPLQAGNGRDALMDAYQEALDLAQYLKQAMEERVRWADDAIASHERIFGTNRESEVKHESNAQVSFVEVADEAGEAFHETYSDQADTRGDETGGRVPTVQAQAHRSSVVATAEHEEARRREAAKHFADTMSALSSAETLKAIKASQDKLRREGAAAALLMLADQCWHERDVVLRLKSRIEAGEVTPWAK